MMRAHPFGLASAVLSFNRLPAIATMVTRRCLGACCAFCFDDTARGKGLKAVLAAYSALGADPDPSKQQPMVAQVLGVLSGFSGRRQSLEVRLDVKPGLRESLGAETEQLAKLHS